MSPSETLATTRVMTLKRRWCASPTNPAKAGHYVYLDASDWCNVVAITRDRRVVMIEQFRHGLGEVTLEFAGGIVERGEDPAAAGVRELLEETGYAGKSHGVIGTVSANPAIFNNRVHTVLVTECELSRGPERMATRRSRHAWWTLATLMGWCGVAWCIMHWWFARGCMRGCGVLRRCERGEKASVGGGLWRECLVVHWSPTLACGTRLTKVVRPWWLGQACRAFRAIRFAGRCRVRPRIA